MEITCCPKCGGNFNLKPKEVNCRQCQTIFRVKDGIPLMFWPRHKVDSVTAKVKSFYETTPFPNYDGVETAADLIEKAKKGKFAQRLNEILPFNSLVLDAGCGTGQLANFLSLANRQIFGTDMSLASLKLAEEFKQRNELKRVSFYQMNLFQPIFKPGSFDVVICTGVLHHTPDPKEGLIRLSRLAKPGGLVIIGLYHRWGRVVNRWRRLILWLSGGRLMWLDPHLRKIKDKSKQKAWFEDQYHHPHESVHDFKQVKSWFDQAEIDWMDVIPKSTFQLLLTGGREGGLFIMIGRKR
jgi:SAM-dependent methyltransferase